MDEILSKIGLTKNEIKVYRTLLSLGSALAGEITSHSGIHRRNVYDSLERLKEKGLVGSVIMNYKKCFKAADPSRLFTVLDEQRNKLKTLRKAVEVIVPQLRGLPAIREKQDVMYFKGKEGIKTVYEDILITGKDYVGYGPGIYVDQLLKGYLRQFIKRRIKQKMNIRMVSDDRSRGAYFTETPLTKVRFLEDKFFSYSAVRIYGDKVAIILFSKKDPIALLIENKEIASSYKKYFNILWEIAKP